jgi:alkanesulfonate monooxygenase SsuD/methylene tetrahydromethanopterin reductase-like flavin-dependent oxidoreductase (luciferase family)
VKFGILLNHQYPRGESLATRLQEIVELVTAASELGFDSVFGVHHYLAELQTPQPLTLLSRLIPVSGEMELGTGVFISTLAHPVHIAEEVATLDQLSGGRVILGVGAGYRRDEFQSFGVNPRTIGRRFVESLEVLRALWSAQPVTHEGEFYRLRDQSISVPPARAGGPPLWIGANAPRTILRAARIGDAWIPSPNVKPRWAIGNLASFRQEAQAHGRLDGIMRYPILRETYVSTSRSQADAEAGRFIREEYRHYSSYSLDFFDTMFDDLYQKAFLWGSPDDIAAGIDNLARGGFDHFMFRMSWLRMPFSLTMRSLEMMAKEVIPRYR